MSCLVEWHNRALNLSLSPKPRRLGGGGRGTEVSASKQDQGSLSEF